MAALPLDACGAGKASTEEIPSLAGAIRKRKNRSASKRVIVENAGIVIKQSFVIAGITKKKKFPKSVEAVYTHVRRQ